MISLNNISKTFYNGKQSFKALDGINLQVREGDITGIIGSSGAGKSTLIRCVNLLERPDQGTVLINGTEITRLNSKALAKERKKIGMIFQHFNLLSGKTVFDNVALPLVLDKLPDAAIQKKVQGLLQMVGIAEKAFEYPKNLSGGQKQRVAIARALANDPHILLCDEATSALDPATTQSILQLLRDINQRLKITILLITHEMEVIKSICNDVAIIDKGILVAKGDLETLLGTANHFIMQHFVTKKKLPQTILSIMQEEYNEGLFPLIEVVLNGNVVFEKLIDIISNHYKIPYKVIKADIEYIGKVNFGNLLIQLQGSKEQNDKVISYFNQSNIKHVINGYA